MATVKVNRPVKVTGQPQPAQPKTTAQPQPVKHTIESLQAGINLCELIKTDMIPDMVKALTTVELTDIADMVRGIVKSLSGQQERYNNHIGRLKVTGNTPIINGWDMQSLYEYAMQHKPPTGQPQPTMTWVNIPTDQQPAVTIKPAVTGHDNNGLPTHTYLINDNGQQAVLTQPTVNPAVSDFNVLTDRQPLACSGWDTSQPLPVGHSGLLTVMIWRSKDCRISQPVVLTAGLLLPLVKGQEVNKPVKLDKVTGQYSVSVLLDKPHGLLTGSCRINATFYGYDAVLKSIHDSYTVK